MKETRKLKWKLLYITCRDCSGKYRGTTTNNAESNGKAWAIERNGDHFIGFLVI